MIYRLAPDHGRMLCVSGFCSYALVCHVQLLSDRYPYLGPSKKKQLNSTALIPDVCVRVCIYIYISSSFLRSQAERFLLERQCTGARDRLVCFFYCMDFFLLELFLCALRITGRCGRLCISVYPHF